MTSVKDQGSCGSCWAFATVAQAESTLILKNQTDNKVDLSEQYMVKCTVDSDCDGTYYMSHPMDTILGGVPTEAAYPYQPFTNNAGICETTDKVMISASYQYYEDLEETELIALLQKGPLAITASADNWEYYGSGIFTCPAIAGLNHAVLLTGYTPDYWIIKNQWGSDWGMDGYMRIARGRGLTSGCFVGSEAYLF